MAMRRVIGALYPFLVSEYDYNRLCADCQVLVLVLKNSFAKYSRVYVQ